MLENIFLNFPSVLNFWEIVRNSIEPIIQSLGVIIIGLIAAWIVGLVIERAINYLKIDPVLQKVGLGCYFERAGFQINVGRFFGRLAYWFLIIVSVMAVSDILGFLTLSGFLRDVLLYVPNIIIAALIMLIAVVLGNFLRSLVRASVTASKLHASKFLGTLTWWSVIIFGLLTALVQLGIAVSIINTLITGLIAMLALAGGLAFGLGGRDYAASLIEKLRRETE